MTNPYYNPTGSPAFASAGASSVIRSEFDSISDGFDLLPTITGNGSKAVIVNAGATALTVTTGTLALAGDFATVGAYSVTLTATATTALTLPITGTLLSNALTSGSILVGNGGGVATGVAMSGDISITNAGVTAVVAIAGVTVSGTTGTGSVVFNASPSFTTPALGSPSSGNLAACTGYATSALTGLGTGVGTFLATPSSANLAAAVTDETGSGALVFATSPNLTTPSLGIASATSINKVALTAPNTSATLTISDGKTLAASASITLAGTDGKTLTVTNNGTVAGGDAWVLAIAAGKTFTVSASLTLAGTDSTTMTFPSSSASIAALNVEDQTLAGGVRVTLKTLSTGNVTIDPGDRPLQYIVNGGAFTITAPANDGSIILLVTNNGSAGAITFSGFQVSSDTGDTLTTTNGSDFMITIVRINSIPTYVIKALQ